VLPFLARVLPTARFVFIERPSRDVAASLLRLRREYYGDERAWFSVRPREASQWEHEPPVRQVALQLRSVLDAEARLRREVGAERCLSFAYKALCEDPRGVTRHIATFVEPGMKLDLDVLPERFPCVVPAIDLVRSELDAELSRVGVPP